MVEKPRPEKAPSNLAVIGRYVLSPRIFPLLEETAPGKVKKQELMSGHTTFRTGGPAEFFVTPDSAEMTARLIGLCKEEKIPYYMIGNGSNLLVGDRGIRGVVIQTQKEMQQIRTEGNVIRAQAGGLLSKIAAEALAKAL